MTRKNKNIMKPEPRRDVQNVFRTFELEMRMVKKMPKSFYSRAGVLASGNKITR